MVEIRGLQIGQGKPKICLPITGKTMEEIKTEAENLLHFPCDLVEWRGDWFENIQEQEKLFHAIKLLREILGEIPLLFTVRTQTEGGQLSPSPETYRTINLWALEAGADLIDCELSAGEDTMALLVREAHKQGRFVVGSSHDFEKTPPEHVMKARLTSMANANCDIAKIAVMPKTPRDVLALLAVTEEMHRTLPCPLITMSMAGLGAISRLCGEIFGSAVTFGTGGKPSAPGQIEAGKMAGILSLLHQGIR